MSADGGFYIAKVLDKEAAKALEVCRVGLGSHDCGVRILWDQDVYIAAFGTNLYFVPDLRYLNRLDASEIPLTPDYLNTMLGLSFYDKWERERVHGLAADYITKLEALGIHTCKELQDTWNRALEWDSIQGFETWT